MSSMAERSGAIVELHAITDVGLVRPNNEDNFLILDVGKGTYWTAADGARVPEGLGRLDVGTSGLVLAVSDGMGGALAGEVASHLAVTTVAHLMHRFDTQEPYVRFPFAERLRLALEQANRLIYEKGQQRLELAGMGATFTAAACHQGWLYLGQVGDSRAYLIRAGRIRQLTKDQSLVHHLVEAGFLTEEQAERHVYRNVILQALGAHPHTVIVMDRIEMRDEDLVLLCSDGLFHKVPAPEICEIVLKSSDVAAAAHELVRLARERGGEDNITVVLARFRNEAWARAQEGEEPILMHLERDERLPETLEPELWDELVRFIPILSPSGTSEARRGSENEGEQEAADADPPGETSSTTDDPEISPGEFFTHPGEPKALARGIATGTVARALLVLLLLLFFGAILSTLWYLSVRERRLEESQQGPSLVLRSVAGP